MTNRHREMMTHQHLQLVITLHTGSEHIDVCYTLTASWTETWCISQTGNCLRTFSKIFPTFTIITVFPFRPVRIWPSECNRELCLNLCVPMYKPIKWCVTEDILILKSAKASKCLILLGIKERIQVQMKLCVYMFALIMNKVTSK